MTYDIVLHAADVIIKEQLQSLKQKEFETARLQCRVKNPKNMPVKWFKNGTEINPKLDPRQVIVYRVIGDQGW